MYRPRFGGPGETILREVWNPIPVLFNPGVTFYATRRERQVFPAGAGRQNEPSNKEMAMTRILARLTVLVFAITISISAFAGSTKTDTITLYHDAQLNGTTIPAGEYTVKCESNGSTAQVKFMKSGKEVASASGQAKDLAAKPSHGQVVIQDGGGVRSITEVDLAGSKTAVTFDTSMANAGK
jgi:hypothetical protein